MSKEALPIEFRVTTKDEYVIYEGFERVMAVRAYGNTEAQKQYERRGNDDWKVKCYKPEKNIFDKPKTFK